MKLPAAKDYPKELHVNEETYTVKFASRLPGCKRNVSGLCVSDGDSRVIYIRRGMTKSQTFRAFIHEVLHAMEFEYEIKISHDAVHQYEKAIGDLLLTNF